MQRTPFTFLSTSLDNLGLRQLHPLATRCQRMFAAHYAGIAVMADELFDKVEDFARDVEAAIDRQHDAGAVIFHHLAA